MFHIAFTPNVSPTNALSASSPTLIGAIAALLKSLDSICEDWMLPHLLEAIDEAVDNMEENEPAKGTWTDMGCDDDAFSIDIFCADDARYVRFDNNFYLAPHGAVALGIGEHNCQEWIYAESDVADWDNVLRPIWKDPEDGLDAAVRSVIDERCEHTGMTRDELESLCGNPGLDALRYHVSGAIERGEAVAIVGQPAKSTITSVRRDVIMGCCTMFGTIDGTERHLFSYYIDELAFSDSDLIGLTEDEAHKLRLSKDVAYLRS